MASPNLPTSLGNESECPLCFKPLTNPEILSCNHRFCQDCLEDSSSNASAEKDLGISKCPVCRDDFEETEKRVEDFKSDHIARNTAQIITKSQKESDTGQEGVFVEKKFKITVITLEGIKLDGWGVNDITSCTVGIILSGAKVGKSYISVFSEFGELLSQIELPTEFRNYKPWRYCSFLTEAKVVSVCQPNEIGIFDIFLKTNLKKKIISQENATWQDDRVVSCITTACESDAGRGSLADRIFVGGKYCRDVFVFDDDLNYVRTLTLPETVAWPKDMTFHKDLLLVCDLQGKRVCALNIFEGTVQQTEYEFPKPNGERAGWAPISVCSGKTGSIYVLWKATVGKPSRILIQYSSDGNNKLREQSVHEDARCLSTLESDGVEKLLVGTFGHGNVYVLENRS